MKRGIITGMFCAAMLVSGCGSAASDEAADREVINQISLLQGLTLGDYYGSISVKDLKKLGDTGIGTFNALNGELIMVNGAVFRAAGDGSVETAGDEETIPFADVTFFDADVTRDLTDVTSLDDLKEDLNRITDEYGRNRFYMVKADGVFDTMNVRSETAQEEPYRPLLEVLETDQTFFDYENISGTLIGLYCPAYMDRLNGTGWHFHFISSDRARGGHVLDLSAESVKISMDVTLGFAMKLPEQGVFGGFDLTQDQSSAIRIIENGD